MGPALTPSVPPALAAAIVAAGRRLDRFGWVPATAGNISHLIAPGRLAITRSGVHKGELTPEDVIEVDLDGNPALATARPSAETMLHCQIYRECPGTAAIVHGHSVAATVLSMTEPSDSLHFEGYEVQKAFENQTTHAAELILPLLGNDQDMTRLAAAIAPRLASMRAGYLIRGHGTYTWGPTMQAALARFEALEFLLSCTLERRRLP